jgi:hypothetical protein
MDDWQWAATTTNPTTVHSSTSIHPQINSTNKQKKKCKRRRNRVENGN